MSKWCGGFVGFHRSPHIVENAAVRRNRRAGMALAALPSFSQLAFDMWRILD